MLKTAFAFAVIFAVATPSLAGPNIVIFGASGSGKGTAAKQIVGKYGSPHISSGDIVRGQIDARTPFGLKVAELTAGGHLLPDTTEFMGELMEAVKARLASASDGFVLDGIPRNARQVIRLDTALRSLGKPLDLAVLLNVSHETVMKRLRGRLNCKGCGASYHREFRKPLFEGLCDKCCEPLVLRADDTEEVIARRLGQHDAEIAPVIEYYGNQGILLTLDGEESAEEVFAKLSGEIDRRFSLRRAGDAGAARTTAETPQSSTSLARQSSRLTPEAPTVFPRDYLAGRIATFAHDKVEGLKIYNLVEMYKEPALIQYITQSFAEVIRDLNPDFIASPEARALPVFGALVQSTGKPGLFIRKAGKLPAAVPKLSASYRTAYSDETLELSSDENLRGKTVVIVDDGISSGGTTLATVKLLEAAGMKVIRILAMIQYHYRPLDAAYVEKGLPDIATTLFDLH